MLKSLIILVVLLCSCSSSSVQLPYDLPFRSPPDIVKWYKDNTPDYYKQNEQGFNDYVDELPLRQAQRFPHSMITTCFNIFNIFKDIQYINSRGCNLLRLSTLT